ncbi:MAG TPA: hypothetical protein VGT78_08325 [Rhizomicrobium sp.]|nr:hypothetical protein [Rhizomicrobium sp.]
MKKRIPSAKERFEEQRASAKRAALRALARARKAAETSGEKLSEWEGEFLGSVEGRVEKYGRAFHDPDKGAPGMSLSIRQTVKLKEIAGKGKKKQWGRSKNGFRRAGSST